MEGIDLSAYPAITRCCEISDMEVRRDIGFDNAAAYFIGARGDVEAGIFREDLTPCFGSLDELEAHCRCFIETQRMPDWEVAVPA